MTGFGHRRWGISLVTRRDATRHLARFYFVSFTHTIVTTAPGYGLPTPIAFPALLADSPGLDSLPRGASPAAVGSAARANQRITSWPSAAVGWYNGLQCAGGGVSLAGVEAELWLHENWIAAYLPPLPAIDR